MVTLYTLNNKLVKAGSKFYGIIAEPTPPGPLDEVTIGSQTWKTQNLAIDDGQGGIYTHRVNYGQSDVVEYYYTWDAAVRIVESIQGWHIPSNGEWDTLRDTVGGNSVAGTKLKSSYGWSSGNGNDDYRFAAFPAGYRSGIGYGYYQNILSGAAFWTTNIRSSTRAYVRGFDGGSSMTSSTQNKTDAYTVRLIKDS